MNREGDNKSTVPDQTSQLGTTGRYGTENEQQMDNGQHSQLDDIDQVEGRMNNGEIGLGITKQDDESGKSE